MINVIIVPSILLVPEVLLLVKQICPRTTQIYDFRTPVSILFQSRTFEAVESITDALSSTDDTLILIVTERALVAYSY